jgi:flagellar L-ring protein precursor FlgH
MSGNECGREARLQQGACMTARRLTVARGAAACLAQREPPAESVVDTPMATPLASAPLNVNTQGAIYQAGTPLLRYETPRAQHIGDVLTTRLAESYNDNNSATAAASRSSSITADAADHSTNAAARLARLFNIGSASAEYKGQRHERHARRHRDRHDVHRQSRGVGREGDCDERQPRPVASVGYRQS